MSEEIMLKVSNEELSKIAQFISSVDDMINGKFILADVKITRVLNMIAGSDELYRYISECMIGFDFSREYHRAEAKNSLNGGAFVCPTEPKKLVAFVFCTLVECDAKRLDFYNFINDNFAGETRTDAYKNFSQILLMPFKEIVASHFGLEGIDEAEMLNMTNAYRDDLMQNPVFESEENKTYFESQDIQNASTLQAEANAQFQSGAKFEQSQNEIEEEIYKNFTGETEQVDDVWKDICDICTNIESAVYTERKLKDYLREELLYILKTIKYCTKYKDVRLVSAFATAFDELSKKYRSVQFVFGELKNKLQTLYK